MIRRVVLLVGVLGLLGGCATVKQPTPSDPYERFNRSMYQVHLTLDKAIKPAAQVYDERVPLPVKAGLGSVFANAGDLWIGANNLMQGKPSDAGSDLGRFLINTTLGIFGLFDVASEMGFEKHDEDLGQTLATWGVGDGGYLFLPLMGPRSLRDGGGWIVDLRADPLFSDVRDMAVRNSLIGVKALQLRASLLPTDEILEEATDDPYSYIREAYLQRRNYLIHDGNLPPDDNN